MRRSRETELAGWPVVLEGEIEPPASAEDLDALLDYAGGRLPPEYLDAIRAVDGFEATFGEPDEYGDPMGDIILDSCREVLRTVEAFGLRAKGSRLLPVGGNGSGEVHAIDLDTQEWAMVNRADLDTGDAAFRFKDLRALLDALATGTAFDRA